jgi:hypothetical protein
VAHIGAADDGGAHIWSFRTWPGHGVAHIGAADDGGGHEAAQELLCLSGGHGVVHLSDEAQHGEVPRGA